MTLRARTTKALQRGWFSLLNSSAGALLVLLIAMMLLQLGLRLADDVVGASGYVEVWSPWPLLLGAKPGDSACSSEGSAFGLADNLAGRVFIDIVVEEPIDAVYTWVNGSEPQQQHDVALWQQLQRSEDGSGGVQLADGNNKNATTTSNTSSNHTTATNATSGNVHRNGSNNNGSQQNSSRSTNETTSRPASELSSPLASPPTLSTQQLDDQSSRSRFEDHDELLYSLRSLEQYAGWVRRVYLVTNGQVPTWLNLSHPRITVVTHAELFPNHSHLPTFSSPAIECHLHRIPGLSKKFLYLNDDTMFGAPVIPADFYSKTKGQRLFYSWPVPQCADGCPAAWLGDGTCDRQCNVSTCDYDSGDCHGPNVKTIGGGGGGGGNLPPMQPIRGVPPQQSNALCHGKCADAWIGDRYCDTSCNHRACGYDGGDCGAALYVTDPQFLRFRVPLTPHDVHALEARHPQHPSTWNASRSPPNAAYARGPVGPPGKATSGNHTSDVPSPGPATASSAPTATGSGSAPSSSDVRQVVIRGALRVGYNGATDATAFLLNLTDVFPISSPGSVLTKSKITSGDHDSPSWVRSASILQAYKILVVSIIAEWPRMPRTCQFVIEGERTATVVSSVGEDGNSRTSPTPHNAPSPASEAAGEIIRVKLVLNVTIFNASSDAERPAGPSRPWRRTYSRSLTVVDEDENAGVKVPTTKPGTLTASAVPTALRATDGTSAPSEAPSTTANAAATTTARKLQQLQDEEAENAAVRRRWTKQQLLLAEDNDDVSDVGTLASSWKQSTSASVEDDKEKIFAPFPSQRRLFDLFGDSLKYTNMLMTRKYRSSSRKVPAHMVHLIHRQVMEELWNEWPAEWEATSASKFRSRTNLQYAFMHYYWMVHATRKLNATELFRRMVDVDGSGVVERREFRRVALLLFEGNIPETTLEQVARDVVRDCLAATATPAPGAAAAELCESSSNSTATNMTGNNTSATGGDTHSNSSAASTAPPAAQGNVLLEVHDNAEVCQEVLRIPGTARFVALVRPPPPTAAPEAATTNAAQLSTDSPPPPPPPTIAEVHAASVGESPHSSQHRVNASWAHAHLRNHSRNASSSSLHGRYSGLQGGSLNSTAHAASATEAPPNIVNPAAARFGYKPPSLNPDDRIKPLTEPYLQLVVWLLRAAATGVRMRTPDEPMSRNGSSSVTWPTWSGVNETDALALSSNLSAVDPISLDPERFYASHVGQLLLEKYGNIKRYRVTLEEMEDVTFVMVRNNRTVVRHQMDHVLFKRPKFLCVNDDMNHSSPDYPAILHTLQSTFASYYPKPSSFELQDGHRNAFTRLPPEYAGTVSSRYRRSSSPEHDSAPSRKPHSACANCTGTHEEDGNVMVEEFVVAPLLAFVSTVSIAVLARTIAAATCFVMSWLLVAAVVRGDRQRAGPG